MPALSRQITHGSDLEKDILKEIQTRVRESERRLGNKYKKYQEAEDKSIAYVRETEVDRLRKMDKDTSGLQDYTTIQIPYSYAVLMAAHTYVTSVFLGRSPVFQFSGRHGETEQSVQALEAIIDYQMVVGEILVPIYIWLHDALKYGIGVTTCYWEDRVESFTEITEQQEVDELGYPIGNPVKLQSTTPMHVYSGNRLKNIQPQDFLWDTRFPAWNFQAGEYCATRFALTWNEMIRKEAQGIYMNLDHLKGQGDMSDQYAGTADSSLERAASLDNSGPTYQIGDRPDKHPNMVRGYEVCVELIPKEWKLGSSPYPEKWVFTSTNNFSVLLGAQPLGLRHCKYPYSVLSLEPEGYGLNTRGFAEILEPVQNTVDWLINSHFFNVRATLNNQFIVDPSRIVMKDLLRPKPGKVVRLKPNAYGTDPKLAVAQMQTQDVTQNHLRDLQMMLGVGERTVGINDQIMGMLNGGGRKTATEVRTSTSFGVNRLKTISEFFSASGFDSLAKIMVANTQQYYDVAQKFKIAGNLMQGANRMMVVDPSDIAGSYDFVSVDGTLPIDRFAQMSIWQQMMTMSRQMPEIAAQYDFGRIFEYVAQLGGLKNIGQFKIQLAPDQQLALQAQAGNSVPIKAGGAPSAASTSPPGAPKQIPGMGVAG